MNSSDPTNTTSPTQVNTPHPLSTKEDIFLTINEDLGIRGVEILRYIAFCCVNAEDISCRVTQKTLAKHCKSSVTTVKAKIDKLIAHGLIERFNIRPTWHMEENGERKPQWSKNMYVITEEGLGYLGVWKSGEKPDSNGYNFHCPDNVWNRSRAKEPTPRAKRVRDLKRRSEEGYIATRSATIPKDIRNKKDFSFSSREEKGQEGCGSLHPGEREGLATTTTPTPTKREGPITTDRPQAEKKEEEPQEKGEISEQNRGVTRDDPTGTTPNPEGCRRPSDRSGEGTPRCAGSDSREGKGRETGSSSHQVPVGEGLNPGERDGLARRGLKICGGSEDHPAKKTTRELIDWHVDEFRQRDPKLFANLNMFVATLRKDNIAPSIILRVVQKIGESGSVKWWGMGNNLVKEYTEEQKSLQASRIKREREEAERNSEFKALEEERRQRIASGGFALSLSDYVRAELEKLKQQGGRNCKNR